MRARRAVADGIGQQVRQGALDHQAIAVHLSIAAEGQGQLFVFGTEGEQVHHPRRFSRQRHRRERSACRRVADLGQKQHVGDDTRQALQLFGAGFEHGFVFVRRALARQRQLGFAHQVGQGRAQFVGKVIGELRQLLHPSVQAIEHHIKALRQLAQLLGQVVDGKAMGEVLSGDFGRHMAELFQRRQAALHQPPGTHADQQQQHGQGDHRGAQIGTEQRLIVGAVQGQQHAYTFAAGQAHQAGGTEHLVAITVGPVEVTEGFPWGEVSEQRRLRLGPGAQQHAFVGGGADDGQVEVVMADHQVHQ